MEIKTERLTLRPLGPEYLESTHAYAADPETTKYMMFLPVDSIDETRRFLSDCEREWQKSIPGFYEFAVLLCGVHIGGVSLYFDTAPDVGELGWILSPGYQGRGYATEAARALIEWGREALGVRHFIAHCDAENAASQAVMDRLGLNLTDDAGTRKNRGSDEVRRECMYELWV